MPQPKSVLQPTHVLHGHMHAVPCGWQLGASWHVELMPAHAAISQLGNSAFYAGYILQSIWTRARAGHSFQKKQCC